MKTITICTLGIMSSLLLACSASIKSSPPSLPPVTTDDKIYSESALAGIVFGKEWVSQVAVAKKGGGGPHSIVVDIYSEPLQDPCSHGFVNSPMVSLVIDKVEANVEYKYFARNDDTGNPATFYEYANGQIIADETKAKIRTVLDDGFELLLYAKGIDFNLQTLQINGRILVKDCRLNQ